MDGQGTTWRRNIAENFNRLSRVHQRYRRQTDRQTDGRPMTYSEPELEFTFAKNNCKVLGLTTTKPTMWHIPAVYVAMAHQSPSQHFYSRAPGRSFGRLIIDQQINKPEHSAVGSQPARKVMFSFHRAAWNADAV